MKTVYSYDCGRNSGISVELDSSVPCDKSACCNLCTRRMLVLIVYIWSVRHASCFARCVKGTLNFVFIQSCGSSRSPS